MKKLKTSIEMAVPGVDVVCRVGRRTSFEVVVDGALIHSKLRVGKLPDFDHTVEIIKTVWMVLNQRKCQRCRILVL